MNALTFKNKSASPARAGFTLVELSIVLVILGLLVGGVLAGQSLIRSAEVRNVATQIAAYQAAVGAFREKYMGLPGDITNATAYWGTESVAGGAGTANGDANGRIALGTENYRAWEQMALAGLIEGSWWGTQKNAGVYTGGEDVPSTKLNRAVVLNFFQDTTYTNRFLYNQNIFSVESIPADNAWNLDTKMDDGRANSGNVGGVDTAACVDAADQYILSGGNTACFFQVVVQ